jgi:hypothetical protein
VTDVERKVTVRGLCPIDCESSLKVPQAWEASLTPDMCFAKGNTRLQGMLFETGSNSNGWCFFTAHLMHACTVLGIAYVSPLHSVHISARCLLLRAPELGCFGSRVPY